MGWGTTYEAFGPVGAESHARFDGWTARESFMMESLRKRAMSLCLGRQEEHGPAGYLIRCDLSMSDMFFVGTEEDGRNRRYFR